MTTLDSIVLFVFHVCTYVLAVLLVIYFVTDWAWRLLEAIYKRIWRLEYLVRTARHCARQTYLRPPSTFTQDGRAIPQKRGDDGQWYQPEGNDEK